MANNIGGQMISMRQLVLGIVAVGVIALLAIALYANKGKLMSKADEDEGITKHYIGGEFVNSEGFVKENVHYVTFRKQEFICADGWEAVGGFQSDVFEGIETTSEIFGDIDEGYKLTPIDPASVNPNPREDTTDIGRHVSFNRVESNPDEEYEYEIYDILTIQIKTKKFYGYLLSNFFNDPVPSSFEYEGPEDVKSGEITLCKRKMCKKPATSFLGKPAYAIEATPCSTPDIDIQ